MQLTLFPAAWAALGNEPALARRRRRSTNPRPSKPPAPIWRKSRRRIPAQLEVSRLITQLELCAKSDAWGKLSFTTYGSSSSPQPSPPWDGGEGEDRLLPVEVVILSS